jgi:hypothetical protein
VTKKDKNNIYEKNKMFENLDVDRLFNPWVKMEKAIVVDQKVYHMKYGQKTTTKFLKRKRLKNEIRSLCTR